MFREDGEGVLVDFGSARGATRSPVASPTRGSSFQALPQPQRATAAWRVFEITHPVADQGEDAAAGPMMELVLEFWPENHQALYHAGIAEYAQGETARARGRLEAFLAAYKQPDNFTNTAKLVLDRIEKGQPADPSMGLGRH
jgi:hypothetical protein